MILVDSSVWIDFFNGVPTPETDRLDALLGQDDVATGDLILVEVLQGIRNDSDFRAVKRALSEFPSFDLLGRERAARVAMRYRRLRRNGVTIRTVRDRRCRHRFLLRRRRDPVAVFSDRDRRFSAHGQIPLLGLKIKFMGLKPVIYLH